MSEQPRFFLKIQQWSIASDTSVSPESPQYSEPLQPETQFNFQSSATQNNRGANPHNRGITLRIFLWFYIPYFTRRIPVMVVEISADNHAASSLPHWRCTMPMHSGGQLWNFRLQSQPSCHQSRLLQQFRMWRSSSCADLATPHPPPGQQYSTNRPSSPTRRRTFRGPGGRQTYITRSFYENLSSPITS